MRVFNVESKKIGGIRFIKIGRLTFSFCVSRSMERPAKAKKMRKSLPYKPVVFPQQV